MVTGEDFLHRFLFFPLSLFLLSFLLLLLLSNFLLWPSEMRTELLKSPWMLGGRYSGEAEESARLRRKGRPSSPRRAARTTSGRFYSVSTSYSSLPLGGLNFFCKVLQKLYFNFGISPPTPIPDSPSLLPGIFNNGPHFSFLCVAH